MVNMQSQTTAIWINVSSLHFSYPYVFLFKMQNANIYSRYKKRQDIQLSFSWESVQKQRRFPSIELQQTIRCNTSIKGPLYFTNLWKQEHFKKIKFYR